MWTPIINNLVVIAVLGLLRRDRRLAQDPAATISGFEIQLLGFGTTLGIVAQTVALAPGDAPGRIPLAPAHRTSAATEVAEIGRMGGLDVRLHRGHSGRLPGHHEGRRRRQRCTGVTEYNYAWLLFQLPYAVVGISVITALLPRMSAHAAERRYGLVRQDFSVGHPARRGHRRAVLARTGRARPEASRGLPRPWRARTPAAARYIGVVFAVFCLGLLPYMIFQLQLRVFYALHDSKTPALIGLVTMTRQHRRRT